MAHNGNGIINANINQNYGANLSIGANSNFGKIRHFRCGV